MIEAVYDSCPRLEKGILIKIFAQRHPVQTFLLITFAWTWLFWLAAIPFRGQTLLVMTIVLIGGYGPAIGGILTLRLRSSLRLDLFPRKVVTLVIAAAVIFALLTLRYLAGNIPNYDTLAKNLTLSAPIILTALAASLVGGWVISSAVSRNADIGARMASILPGRLPAGWTILGLLFYPALILTAWALALLLGAEVEYPVLWRRPVLEVLPLYALTSV
jgi:hypothetical protein